MRESRSSFGIGVPRLVIVAFSVERRGSRKRPSAGMIGERDWLAAAGIVAVCAWRSARRRGLFQNTSRRLRGSFAAVSSRSASEASVSLRASALAPCAAARRARVEGTPGPLALAGCICPCEDLVERFPRGVLVTAHNGEPATDDPGERLVLAEVASATLTGTLAIARRGNERDRVVWSAPRPGAAIRTSSRHTARSIAPRSAVAHS